jgi:hypothetical protein
MKAIRITDQFQRAFARDMVDTTPFGWVVTFKEEKRRDAQNRLFWEVMDDLVRAQPEGIVWPKETWAAGILHATGHEMKFEKGLDGTGAFPVGFRTSQLGVSQMSLCIEYAFSYGARHGVVFTIDRRRAVEFFGLAA